MNNEVRLGDSTYPVVRYKLKSWLQLDELNNKTLKAAETSNANEFISNMLSYLSTAFGISTGILAELDWHEISVAYKKTVKENAPRLKLPIFVDAEEIVYPWDYLGRNWYLWAHKLSFAYSWTLEYIAELDIDDATALVQEMLIQDQFDKEWEWRRSQVAYGYNSTTKKTEFLELPRPKWMQGTINKELPAHLKEMQMTRVPRNMLPLGLVVKADGTSVINPQS